MRAKLNFVGFRLASLALFAIAAVSALGADTVWDG